MKAKIKKGDEILFSEGASNNWEKIEDCMIINFMNKYTYKSFKQTKSHLLIDTSEGEVDIVFTGEVPILEFEGFYKDQLVLNIKKMNEKIIFKAVVGSQSYGTSTPESDVDIKGIYTQDISDLVTFGYKEQIEVNKDEVYFEVRRFLQLLQTANPTVLELLYSPEDCILKTSPQFELIRTNRDIFLTKECLKSFGGYAVAQIKKAKGLDKKMNWEKQKVIRKTPLDFIYCYNEGKTMPLTKWLNGRSPNNCGLAGLNHFRDCFALYYGDEGKYSGIAFDKSNSVRLSSIPKGIKPDTIIFFNKDAYSTHCRDYKEYEIWLKNRNIQRYVDIEGHGQKIDGKNLLHCRRLIDTCIEIATEKTINVRRPNAEYLISIRKGQVPLEKIIEEAEIDLKRLDELFAKSNLPDSCDQSIVNELLLQIRMLSAFP